MRKVTFFLHLFSRETDTFYIGKPVDSRSVGFLFTGFQLIDRTMFIDPVQPIVRRELSYPAHIGWPYIALLPFKGIRNRATFVKLFKS